MIPNHIYNLPTSAASAKTHTNGSALRKRPVILKPVKPADDQLTETTPEPAHAANAIPTYPGGANALLKFLKDNINHDITKADGDVEDHLSLMFVVEKNGKLSHVDVNRLPGGRFTDATITEVKRVLASGPKWIPAVINGEPVTQRSFVIFDFTKAKDEVMFRPDTTRKVYTAVEVQPEFPGGEKELVKFLQRTIRYPSEDHAKNIQGRVYIQFIVEADGTVDNLKVLRAPSEAMGAEAVRVMALSPKWTPGKQGGSPVRVEFTMPLNFSLSNEGPQAPFKINPMPPVTAGTSAPVSTPDNNAIYTAAQIQPEFPGGSAGLMQFIQQTISYPAAAKQNRVQGKVYVQFVVEKDGSLSNIKVLREPGSGTGDEAVRVMKLSPKWKPGMQNDQPVRIQFTLPVSFTLPPQ